jgi:hypothetical protein
MRTKPFSIRAVCAIDLERVKFAPAAIRTGRWDREFADSPLEQAGFEPLVPRQAPRVFAVSVLVRADFLRMSRNATLDAEGTASLRICRRFPIDLLVAGLHQSRHLSEMRQGVI